MRSTKEDGKIENITIQHTGVARFMFLSEIFLSGVSPFQNLRVLGEPCGEKKKANHEYHESARIRPSGAFVRFVVQGVPVQRAPNLERNHKSGKYLRKSARNGRGFCVLE